MWKRHIQVVKVINIIKQEYYTCLHKNIKLIIIYNHNKDIIIFKNHIFYIIKTFKMFENLRNGY